MWNQQSYSIIEDNKNDNIWYFIEDGESEFDIGISNAIESVEAQKEFLYPTKEAILLE